MIIYTVTVRPTTYGVSKRLGEYKTLRGAKCAATRYLNRCWKGDHHLAEILDNWSGKRRMRLQHSAGLGPWQEEYRRY